MVQLVKDNELSKWICTDPDNLQYRKGNEPFFREFDRNSFPEIFRGLSNNTNPLDLIGNPIYWDLPQYWIEEYIDLNNVQEEEILNHCSPYYDTNEVKEWLVNGKLDDLLIISECIFEQENGLY